MHATHKHEQYNSQMVFFNPAIETKAFKTTSFIDKSAANTVVISKVLTVKVNTKQPPHL